VRTIDISNQAISRKLDKTIGEVNDAFDEKKREIQSMYRTNVLDYDNVTQRQSALERKVEDIANRVERNKMSFVGKHKERVDGLESTVGRVQDDLLTLSDNQTHMEADMNDLRTSMITQNQNVQIDVQALSNRLEMDVEAMHDRLSAQNALTYRHLDALHDQILSHGERLESTVADMRTMADLFGDVMLGQANAIGDLEDMVTTNQEHTIASDPHPMPSDPPPPAITNSPKARNKHTVLVIKEANEPSQSVYFNNIQILQDKPQKHPPLPDISGHKRRKKRAPKSTLFKRRRK
jgi:hypothetical protein